MLHYITAVHFIYPHPLQVAVPHRQLLDCAFHVQVHAPPHSASLARLPITTALVLSKNY